jgi:CheY-like chemotaxis protein
MMEKRLLICDDELAFGRFVQNVAEELGYEVAVTTDGRAFIQAYESFRPTIIVLDMVMPGLDGNELITWLAEQQSPANLIIITGYTPDYANNAETLAKFKGLRPIAAMRKPVDLADLRAVLAPGHTS